MIIIPDYFQKSIAVFGLGTTGISIINVLRESGAKVYAWDDKNIPVIDGVNFVPPSTYDWGKIDELILSPGVPFRPKPHEIVLMAQKSNCKISCDIDLLYKSQPSAKFIGVTGTNGKSTTVSLIHHILKKNNKNSCLGGNIGIPVLELDSGADIYALELSSYQLDLCTEIKFDIGVLLNITPDHLDRHGNMENYTSAKKKIFGHISVIGLDNKINKKLYEEDKRRKIGFSTKDVLQKGFSLIDNKIFEDGTIISNLDHNNIIPENLIAAYTVCSLLGIHNNNIIDSIKTFKSLPHRMEFVGKISNMTFINDSKATNAVSTQQALSKYKNIYWIVGGRPKKGGINNLDFTNVKKAFLIGESEDEFAIYLAKYHVEYTKLQTLENALKEACEEASSNKGEFAILFSPACSSFDQWKNFEERGEAFKNAVLKKVYRRLN